MKHNHEKPCIHDVLNLHKIRVCPDDCKYWGTKSCKLKQIELLADAEYSQIDFNFKKKEEKCLT